MHEHFLDCPIIASVKNSEQLENALLLDNEIIFLLFGDICNISDIVQRTKQAGKIVFVHVDLITGLGSKKVIADFIRTTTEADGIISTQAIILKRAKEIGLGTILRLFLLDTKSLENIDKQIAVAEPDLIEIMPGVMPKILKKLSKQIEVPIITGGLISDKDDVVQALSSGAISVSTSNEKVWQY